MPERDSVKTKDKNKAITKKGSRSKKPGRKKSSDSAGQLLGLLAGELLTSFPEPFILYDRDKRIVYANRFAVESLAFDPTGLSRREISSRLDLRTSRGLKASSGEMVSTAAMSGKTVRNMYYKFRDANGEDHISLGSSAPLLYQGEIIGAISSWHDITEEVKRKQYTVIPRSELELLLRERTDELIESQELLEKIFSNTHLGIAMLDRSFRYIRVNRAFTSGLKLSADSILGKNHFDLHPIERNRKIFDEVLQNRRSFFALDRFPLFTENHRKSREYFDWSVHPVVDDSEKAENLLLMVVDSTKRIRAEEELSEAHIRLQRSERLSSIGTLAATVAHELRNPLGVMKTAIYNIRRKNKDAGLKSHVDNIDKKIDESSRVINNLLNYSRIQTPRQRPVRLSHILTESSKSVKKEFRNRNVRISRQLKQLRGHKVMADPDQLREVFINILHNSFQAIEEGDGEVRVTASIEKGRHVLVEVSDNGVGMDKKVLKRVLDPFFTTKAKGTGLGLAICSELVELNGGSISLNSEKGRGTTVSLILPLGGKKNEKKPRSHSRG